MKTGKTLEELAKELQRQRETRVDYICPSESMESEFGKMKLNEHGIYGIADTAHEQISTKLGIPKKYYDRMKTDAPELLDRNINHWLKNTDERYMVRTLDGDMRALLSNRYRPLDNYELAESVLPQLMSLSLTVESCEITNRRMYLKAVCKTIQAEVKTGDIVQAGIVISNSEIGCGSVRIEPMLYRLVCSNGMISADHSMRKYHVGRGDDDENIREFYRDKTREADDHAFFLKVQDIVRGSLGHDIFNAMINKVQATTGNLITGRVEKAIEILQNKAILSDTESSGILTQLIKGGDISQWGLINAVTRAAHDVEDYDRSTDLERLGGDILVMKPKEWKELAEAA